MKELPEKEELKRQNTVRFVYAAQELIESEGIEHISIRKIASLAGFHNSTIYLYFKDVDQLILLASVKYFREYSHALSEQSRKNSPASTNFIAIWSLFADSIFKRPIIFYNFFFGKHSDDLREIMTMYYEIFPEELEEYSAEIQSMYFGRNIHDRCMNILLPLLEENTAVTATTIEMINDLIVSYCKYKLEQKCTDSSLDEAGLKNSLLQGIAYLAGLPSGCLYSSK